MWFFSKSFYYYYYYFHSLLYWLILNRCIYLFNLFIHSFPGDEIIFFFKYTVFTLKCVALQVDYKQIVLFIGQRFFWSASPWRSRSVIWWNRADRHQCVQISRVVKNSGPSEKQVETASPRPALWPGDPPFGPQQDTQPARVAPGGPQEAAGPEPPE